MPTSIPDISAAIARLRSGGIVAFPTETVYGLGADALSEAAVRRVYELKGRPSINPLIVHVSGPEMAARLVAEWTPDADALARMFWPGPLTIVLPRPLGTATLRVASLVPASGTPTLPVRSPIPSLGTPTLRVGSPLLVPDLVTAGGPTIAVRCPDHPVALALLFGLGSPLVGPSANISGGISPTTAAHVAESFRAEDVLVLEGGACRAGIESTVISLAGDRPRLLRPGLIGAGEIAAILGRPVHEGPIATAPNAPLSSPGLLPRHYAPATPARLVDAPDIAGALRDAGARGCSVVVVSHVSLDADNAACVIRLPDDAQDYAYGMYAALREADALRMGLILIVRPPSEGGAWTAITNRLTRATTA